MSEVKEFVNDLFSDAEVSSKAWEQENESSRDNGGAQRATYIREYYLRERDGENVGLISYLSDGINVQTHHVIDPSIGKAGNVRVHVLCKRKGCELCNGGEEPKRYRVWPIIDWIHKWTTKSGKVMTQPTFKLLIKGVETFKLHDERRKKFGFPTSFTDEDGNVVKSLVGMKWEITRLGKGFQTRYDPMPADLSSVGNPPKPIDFSGTRMIELRDGKTMEVPEINMPDWPEYQSNLPENMVSAYTHRKLRPEYSIDWNNPKHANEWIKLHFLNTPQETYVRLGRSGRPDRDGQSSGHDDDVPF